MLFCLRCLGKPIETFRETEIAFKWRITMQDLAETKALFIENGFIDDTWNVLNWNKRQYVSDSSTERVRQYRERLKQDETLPKQDATEDVTAPEQKQNRTDTEQKQKEPELTLLSPTAPKKEIRPEEFANVWNRLRGKLPKVERFTESRKKKVKTRMNEGLTLERFAEAVENCTTKPFLRGDNDDGWTATFDWLVENDKNLEKAINNPYGSNKPNGGNHAQVPTGKTDHGMAICAELIAEDQYRSRAVQNGGVQASEAKQDGRATLFLDSGAVGHEGVSGGNGYTF
jgi:hypothetical protein